MYAYGAYMYNTRLPLGVGTLYSRRHELVDRSPVLGRWREEDKPVLDRARRGFTIHDPTTVDTYAGHMYMYGAYTYHMELQLGVGTLYLRPHELVD